MPGLVCITSFKKQEFSFVKPACMTNSVTFTKSILVENARSIELKKVVCGRSIMNVCLELAYQIFMVRADAKQKPKSLKKLVAISL